jgi:hypothetical protein
MQPSNLGSGEQDISVEASGMPDSHLKSSDKGRDEQDTVKGILISEVN